MSALTPAERMARKRARDRGAAEPLSAAVLVHAPGSVVIHIADDRGPLCGARIEEGVQVVTLLSRPCSTCVGAAAIRIGAAEAIVREVVAA